MGPRWCAGQQKCVGLMRLLWAVRLLVWFGLAEFSWRELGFV